MWHLKPPRPFVDTVINVLREPLDAAGFELTPDILEYIESGYAIPGDEHEIFRARLREQIRRGPSPGGDVPGWLVELDDLFSGQPMEHDWGATRRPQTLSEACQSFHMTMLLLTAVAASAQHVISMRSNTDFLMQSRELQWMRHAGLPRDADEFERLVALLPRLPDTWHRPHWKGDIRIEQPLRRQLTFALVIRAEIASPGKALYSRLLEVIANAPDEWFGSPGLTLNFRSRRPEFWIGFEPTPPEVRALLRERTANSYLQEKIDDFEEVERKERRAVQAMSSATGTADRFLSHRVDADLAVLTDRINEHCPTLAAKLRDGVTGGELVGFESILEPLKLPGDLAALWRWAGGADGHILFGSDPWLGPEEAFVEYEGWIEVLSEDTVWSKALFPIACTGQHGLFVQLIDPAGEGPTPGDDQTTSAVWEFDLIKGSFIPIFGSIQAMVRTYAEGIEAGLLTDGHYQLEPAPEWGQFSMSRGDLAGAGSFDSLDPDSWPTTIRRHVVGQLDQE